jgi:Metallo-beta-lactamase superfamily
MRTLAIGDVTITSIIERDGPWRRPEDMFPAYDPAIGKRHLAELEPFVFDSVSGRLVITYQTFVVRTGNRTILVDTCTGEDKGYPPPMDFPKAPWLDGFRAAGLRFEDIDYVFCTHLHIDHCGWNTLLRDGRWVPTFPNAKYVFHKREYEAWKEATMRGAQPPGNVWRFNCEPVVAAGQRFWSTTTSRSTTPSRSPRHPAIRRAIAASISTRAAGAPWSPATSCTTPCNAASRTGRPCSTGTPRKPRARGDGFSATSPAPASS